MCPLPKASEAIFFEPAGLPFVRIKKSPRVPQVSKSLSPLVHHGGSPQSGGFGLFKRGMDVPDTSCRATCYLAGGTFPAIKYGSLKSALNGDANRLGDRPDLKCL